MNAVIYARYSSYTQTERSIEGQIEDCTRYADGNNFVIVGQYIDRARSGTSADARPDFQRMIRDAEKRQFEAVLVYKLDRFARNRYDSAIYKAKLKKAGVRVVSVTEAISEDPEGVILEAMLEGLAEYYSRNLSQNVKRGMKIAREHGTFTGGRLPYGYGLDGKKVIVDEHEAEAVRYVYSEYARGSTMREIVEELNRRGYKPRTGAKFTTNSFQSVLRSKKYIGQYTFAQEASECAYPRIIEDELYYAVQDRFAAVRRAPAAGKAKIAYLLQGKLFCGHCGANMVGESGRGKGGAVYHYYACANRKKRHTCKKKNEKKDVIEQYVIDQTLEYVLEPERLDYIAGRVAAEYEKEFSDSSILTLQKQLAQIEREMDDCVDVLLEVRKNAFLTQKITEKVQTLTDRKSEIELDLSKLKIACKNRLSQEEIKKWLKSFASGDPLDEEYRRRIIDIFVNAVYLYDDKIVIYYNVKGGKQVTYSEMLEDTAAAEMSECSDSAGSAPPLLAISEKLRLRSVSFGIAIQRREGR